MNKKSALVVGIVVATLIAGALPADAGNKTRNRNKGTAVAAPANDSFAAGTQVAEMPFEASVNFTAASLDANEPQPSCSSAKSTVWYSVASDREQKLVVRAASQFPNAVAVYSGADLTHLSEVTCVAEGASNEVMFPAASDALYFVQVSAGKVHKGSLEFGMNVDTWETKTLLQDNYSVTVPDVDAPKVVIDGRPRANNPKIYDLTVTAADQTVGPFGLVTDPVKLPAIHQELSKVSGQKIDISLSSTYRYDSAQSDCRLYQGEDCSVGLPVTGDSDWYTDGSGAEAQIVVSIRIESDGKLLAEKTVAVPFAGQFGGLLP